MPPAAIRSSDDKVQLPDVSLDELVSLHCQFSLDVTVLVPRKSPTGKAGASDSDNSSSNTVMVSPACRFVPVTVNVQLIVAVSPWITIGSQILLLVISCCVSSGCSKSTQSCPTIPMTLSSVRVSSDQSPTSTVLSTI